MTLPQQLHDPVIYALPVFVLFMALELASLAWLEDGRRGDFAGYERRDSQASILMGLGSLVVNGAARVGSLLGYSALFAVTPLRWDTSRWYTWLFAILAVDLLYYLQHRAAHRVRLLWAAHQAHHSSRRFNFSTAVRQKWNPWWELIVWIPLPLLGIPPWLIFTAFSINLIFQFFVHTERIGRLPAAVEFVFNTPSHHRVHHASDPDYLDKNYAGILIVWDRLFGSFVAETHGPTYGLTKDVGTYNPFRLQYHEYAAIVRDVRATRRWRDRLGYLFAPPGWRPATAPVSAATPARSAVAPGGS